MTQEQLAALKAITDGIIDACKAGGPTGAPGGVLYAGLMAHGCRLSQFESIMSALCKAGKLRKSGDCYVAI